MLENKDFGNCLVINEICGHTEIRVHHKNENGKAIGMHSYNNITSASRTRINFLWNKYSDNYPTDVSLNVYTSISIWFPLKKKVIKK
jgi:hypothetical protein